MLSHVLEINRAKFIAREGQRRDAALYQREPSRREAPLDSVNEERLLCMRERLKEESLL
jgi:hypothetical protein